MSRLELNFVLVREGTSDDGLLPHLRNLLVRAGAEEAVGAVSAHRGPVGEKLRLIVADGPHIDAIFVHRDADCADESARRSEIFCAAEVEQCPYTVVPVIPIQETESWLLLSVEEIRAVVGRPRGTTQLLLPSITEVESTRNAKEILKQALLDASETAGRRRHKETKAFSQRRRTLLERLDIDGPVAHLPSFQRVVADIDLLVRDIRDQSGGSPA